MGSSHSPKRFAKVALESRGVSMVVARGSLSAAQQHLAAPRTHSINIISMDTRGFFM